MASHKREQNAQMFVSLIFEITPFIVLNSDLNQQFGNQNNSDDGKLNRALNESITKLKFDFFC